MNSIRSPSSHSTSSSQWCALPLPLPKTPCSRLSWFLLLPAYPSCLLDPLTSFTLQTSKSPDSTHCLNSTTQLQYLRSHNPPFPSFPSLYPSSLPNLPLPSPLGAWLSLATRPDECQIAFPIRHPSLSSIHLGDFHFPSLPPSTKVQDTQITSTNRDHPVPSPEYQTEDRDINHGLNRNIRHWRPLVALLP